MRIQRISPTANFGNAESVGDGVYEMRIDYDPRYLLYHALRDVELVLLLLGGDKSSQRKDIEKAKNLDQEYE